MPRIAPRLAAPPHATDLALFSFLSPSLSPSLPLSLSLSPSLSLSLNLSLSLSLSISPSLSLTLSPPQCCSKVFGVLILLRLKPSLSPTSLYLSCLPPPISLSPPPPFIYYRSFFLYLST